MESTEQTFKPSKQFIKRGALAVGILATILIIQTNWFQNIISKKDASGPVVTPTTVGDLIANDTNGNAIPDWEERLWGLDPTTLYTNGTSNAEIIAAKKKSLGVTDTNTAPLDDTDRIARELFVLTAALGQSDEVDDQTLQAIAGKLAASMEIKQVPNVYSLKDIRTVQTSIPSLTQYRTSIQKVFSNYDATIPEIEVLATALQNEDLSGLPQLKENAALYQKLAKELSVISVPVGLAQDHLSIINSFAGIATSLVYMTELDDNSFAALVGIAVYKKYTTKLDTSVVKVNEYLTKYGIL